MAYAWQLPLYGICHRPLLNIDKSLTPPDIYVWAVVIGASPSAHSETTHLSQASTWKVEASLLLMLTILKGGRYSL